MRREAEIIGSWLAHIFTAIIIAWLGVIVVSTFLVPDLLFLPNLVGQLIVITSSVVVAAIVLRAERGEVAEDSVSTSLFTFANSITALSPLIAELLKSVLTAQLSESLRGSVLYWVFSDTNWAHIATWIAVILLTLLALVLAILAARQISIRVQTEWWASTASLFSLIVTNVTLSHWTAVPVEALVAHTAMILAMVLVSALLFAMIFARLVGRIPTIVGAGVSLVQSSLADIALSIWRIFIQFCARLAIYLPLLFIAYYALWEVILPSAVSIPVLVLETFDGAKAPLANLGGELRRGIVTAASTIVVAFIVMLIASWLVATPHRLLQTYGYLVGLRQTFVRLLIILIFFAFTLMLLWFVARSATSLLRSWLAPAPVEQGSSPHIDTKELEDTEAKKTSNSEPSLSQEPSSAPKPPVSLERIAISEVQIDCANDVQSFGWAYASTDELVAQIGSCKLDLGGSPLNDTFFLVAGLASKELLAAPEEIRARERAFRLAAWVQRSAAETELDPVRIYVLNLGMIEGRTTFSRGRSQYNDVDRPVRILRFSPKPKGAEISDRQSFEKVIDYIALEISAPDYSSCELFAYGNGLVDDQVKDSIQSWSCEAER